MDTLINEDKPKEMTETKVVRDAVMRAVNFQVEAIVGDASMTLDELDALTAGSVVTLSSLLSDVVRLRLNGVEIARGELVSVGDNFAIKITEVAH